MRRLKMILSQKKKRKIPAELFRIYIFDCGYGVGNKNGRMMMKVFGLRARKPRWVHKLYESYYKNK